MSRDQKKKNVWTWLCGRFGWSNLLNLNSAIPSDLVFQDGVHWEVWGHNSAFQWQIHQDSTRSTWCVECLFCVIGTRYCFSQCQHSVFMFPHGVHSVHSLVWSVAFTVPTEPLLCKFADGGQKKRQNQGKYLQNGRPWARDGETVRGLLFLTTCCW